MPSITRAVPGVDETCRWMQRAHGLHARAVDGGRYGLRQLQTAPIVARVGV
jgi:hypothetical protein